MRRASAGRGPPSSLRGVKSSPRESRQTQAYTRTVAAGLALYLAVRDRPPSYMYDSLRYELVAVRHAELHARLMERRAGPPSRPLALLRRLHEAPPPAPAHTIVGGWSRVVQRSRRLVTMRWRPA
jgi:hypothetical protein